MIVIETASNIGHSPFFSKGFRVFFFSAALFAASAMFVWMLTGPLAVSIELAGLSAVDWHAHEMVYGYAAAAISGFLLTAVSNWTGLSTLEQRPLTLLWCLWLIARVSFFLPLENAFLIAATADMLFLAGLALAITGPIIKTRQWKQIGIASKIWLLLLTQGLFAGGILGPFENGIYWGLYGGIYLILGLLFTLARRVIPFFIERGTEEKFSPKNERWIDIASPLLFASWAVCDLFTEHTMIVATLSLALALIHGWRLLGWYTPGIWKSPLLWSLLCGYSFLIIGFLLKTLTIWQALPSPLALHAFVVGGIGITTISMMARVTLGHSGGNIRSPLTGSTIMMTSLVISAIIRILMPLIDTARSESYIILSQTFWIAGFLLFAAIYGPLHFKHRSDGRTG